MSIRDHLSDLRWRAANGRTHVSNAWYRAAGRRISGTRQQYRNWLNTRARARGKRPLPDRAARAAGSRVPVYRNRISPATGRPRRDEAHMDRAFSRLKVPRSERAAWERSSR